MELLELRLGEDMFFFGKSAGFRLALRILVVERLFLNAQFQTRYPLV